MSLEVASAAFLEGYRLALADASPAKAHALIGQLHDLGHLRTPFAYEGAAMAWRLSDERRTYRSRAPNDERNRLPRGIRFGTVEVPQAAYEPRGTRTVGPHNNDQWRSWQGGIRCHPHDNPTE